MTPKKTLTTLSIGGATYDLFVPVKEKIHTEHSEAFLKLKAGSKIMIEGMIETTGGGAANSSVGLARLGMNACFGGVLGADGWGEKLQHALTKDCVNVSGATIVDDETSGFSLILLLENGERIIFNHPGTNEHLHDVTFDKVAMLKADVIYLNRLSQAACIIEDDILEVFRMNPKLHLTWNPGGCQLEEGMDGKDKKELLGFTDVLLLNKEEAETFTRIKDRKKAMQALLDAGVKHVVITDGEKGAFATDGKTLAHALPPKVDVVDSTGAGDAFGVGFTWAILNGESLPNAVASGTLNSISVLGAIGAQTGLLTDTEMRERLARHTVKIETSPF